MGGDEKNLDSQSSSRFVEIIREYTPSAAGVGACIGTFFLTKDMPVIIYGLGEVARMPALFGGITGAAFGMWAYNLSNHLLFRPKKEKMGATIDDLVEEPPGKGHKTWVSGPRKVLDSILEHPKTLAFMSILPRLADMGDAAYKFIYKTGNIMHFYHTHAEQIIATHGIDHYNEILNQCDIVIKGGVQTILNGSLFSFGQFVVLAYGFMLLNSLLNSKYSDVTGKIIKGGLMAKTPRYRERGISLLEESLRILPLRETYATLSGIHLDEDNLDEALSYSSKALRSSKRDLPFYRLYERSKLFFDGPIWEFRQTRRRMRKDPNNPETHLRLSLVHHKREEFSRAVKAVEKAEQLAPDDPKIKFYAGELLESVGRDGSAEEKYIKGAKMLLDSGGFGKNFEILGDFNNQVASFKFSKYLQGLFVLKRNRTKSNLQNESEQLNYFRGVCPDSVVKILCGFEHMGMHYLVIKYAGRYNLNQLITSGYYKQENTLYRDLMNCVYILKQIDKAAVIGAEAGRISIEDPAGQDSVFFQRRIERIFMDNLLKDIDMDNGSRIKILEGFKPVNNALMQLPRSFYTDSNLMNWIKRTPSGSITKADFESNIMMPPLYWYINLCEFGSDYLTRPQKENLAEEYLGERMHIFESSMPLVALQRHAEIVGYRTRDMLKRMSINADETSMPSMQWMLQSRRFHLDKALDYCREITNRPDFYRASLDLSQSVEDIGEVLETIHI